MKKRLCIYVHSSADIVAIVKWFIRKHELSAGNKLINFSGHAHCFTLNEIMAGKFPIMYTKKAMLIVDDMRKRLSVTGREYSDSSYDVITFRDWEDLFN